MKKLAAITLTSMMLLVAAAMVAGAVPSVDVRGAMAGYVSGNWNLAGNNDTFTWNAQNFAGFYYDLKNDIGTEKLTFALTGNKLVGEQSPYGIVYETTAQPKEFEREEWGTYQVIGFMAENYFAGYNAGNIFYSETTDKNSLSSEQLEKVLIDDDAEATVTSGTPLKLKEGYELAIKAIDIDGNKVYVELTKDGQTVDSKVVSPSKTNATEVDKTYYYKNPVVGEQKKLVTIGVHFKNAFRGSDSNLATVDGIWQVSDTPAEVKADTQYEKMTIRTVDPAGTITMDNKDNSVTLGKNKDTSLMGGIRIKTADNDWLRFYVYKTITEPGDYQIRGEVFGKVAGADKYTSTGPNTAVWTPQNFAGFFYDLKNDLGKESLTFSLTGANNDKLTGDAAPYGAVYKTETQTKDCERKLLGNYNVMGFMAEKYFAGYNNGGNGILYAETTDKNSLSNEQLEKILIDNKDEVTMTSGMPLKLQEGYELAIKSIDIDGNKVYVELSKNGNIVDSKVVSPSKDNAVETDKTYYYKNPVVGEQKKLVTIAVHFKNAFRGSDSNLASIDGVWQISDTPVEVKADTQYGKMTIRTVDPAGSITMDNKDNSVTMGRNKDTELMPGVSIKTADSDDLRFYVYKPVTVEGAATTTTTEKVAEPVKTEAAKENVSETKTAETPVKEEKPATEPAKNESTKPAETAGEKKPAPGFESLFAIAGLLAVAYLVIGKRE